MLKHIQKTNVKSDVLRAKQRLHLHQQEWAAYQ